MNIFEKIMMVQGELKAPKGQYNDFGEYYYRSCEDILEALKPLLQKYKLFLYLTDSIEFIEGRFYVKAEAIVINAEKTEESVTAVSYAREDESRKKMDGSQITGSTSSYARKYALNGLFNIDDTKDSDATNQGGQQNPTPQNQKGGQPPQNTQNGNTISEAQAKRLFAIAKGNDELVKQVCTARGYHSSRSILKKDYNAICEEVQKMAG